MSSSPLGGAPNLGGSAGSDPVEPPVSAPITVQKGVPCRGLECIVVITEAATYAYDVLGAGFVSIIDRDGNDWVSWNPTPSASGEFRGVPNLGTCCHPGRGEAAPAVTTLSASDAERVEIRSVSVDGSWEVAWEFFSDHARFTVVRPPGKYFMLFEGTPGGALGREDWLGTSDGVLEPLLGLELDRDIAGDSSGSEWVYFLDASLGRALVFAHRRDDHLVDTYWTFDHRMTVFGWGRTCPSGCRGLDRAGDGLVLAFSDRTEMDDVRELAKRLSL